jgi:short chain dehydrogenase
MAQDQLGMRTGGKGRDDRDMVVVKPPSQDPDRRAPSAAFDAKGSMLMPNDNVGNSDGREGGIGDEGEAVAGSIDGHHLLLIGAGPGLGGAVARRFAEGGYRVTLVARSTDGLGKLAGTLADTGADIDTISGDASDPEGLGARTSALYRGMVHRGSSSTTRSWELRTNC